MQKIFRLFIIIILLANGCGTPTEQVNTITSNIDSSDFSAPTLIQISPSHEQQISSVPVTNIQVTGVLQDSNAITASLNDITLSLSLMSNNRYQFVTNIPLVPGENIIILKAQDSKGNRMQKEITYFNGNAPRLVLLPERQQLPPGGTTFLEIFLEKDGQRQPLAIEDVEIRAQRGYLEGSQYQAPSESGSDQIFAVYKQQNAKGSLRMMIRKGEMEVTIDGPKQIRLGRNTEYTIYVRNAGEIESVQNTLSVKIPDNYSFVSASHSGQYLEAVREIHWQLEKLGPGLQNSVSFTAKANDVGDTTFEVNLNSGEENLAQTNTASEVIGVVEIIHTCEGNDLQVDKNITIQVNLTAQENLKGLQFVYYFDSEKIAFIKAEGQDHKNNTLHFQLSGNKVLIQPSLINLSVQDQISMQLQFKIRRAGTIQNRLECTALYGNSEQVLEHSLTLNTD